MDPGERDVVDRRDCNRIRDFAGGESEKFARARGGGDRKFRGVVEAVGHHRDSGCEPALNFIGHSKRQHEFLAGCACLLGRGENGPEVVARMTEAARRHVAVEQIHVADKSGVEERCLIRGCLASADQGAPARSPVFPELFAQRLKGLSWKRSDGAANAIQNIALEELPDVVRQMLRPSVGGEGGDSLNDRLSHGAAFLLIKFRRSGNTRVGPSNPLALPQNTPAW